jgi:Mrp family chromosome partitioning ATPase
LRAGLFDQSRRFDSVVIDAGALGDGALPHLLTELADDIVVVRPASMEAETAERQLQRALAQDAGKVRVIVANQGG